MRLQKQKIVQEEISIPKETLNEMIYSFRKMESAMATIEVLADKECMDSIEKSEEDMKAGRIYSINNEKDLEYLLGVKDE